MLNLHAASGLDIFSLFVDTYFLSSNINTVAYFT